MFQHLLMKAVDCWWLLMMLPDDLICVGCWRDAYLKKIELGKNGHLKCKAVA